MFKKRGSSLIELLMSTAIFGFMTIALLVIVRVCTVSWQAAEAKYAVEQELRRAAADINFMLKNSDIATFSCSPESLSENPEEYTWMAFKSSFYYSGESKNLEYHIDYKLNRDDKIRWHFFVLYCLEPYYNLSESEIAGTAETQKKENVNSDAIFRRTLVKKMIPINPDGALYIDTAPYLEEPEVKNFFKYSKENEELKITSSNLSSNISHFSSSFNDSQKRTGSVSSGLQKGCIRYEMRAFRKFDPKRSALNRDVMNKLLQKQNKITDRRSKHENANLYFIQIVQSVFPLNNSIH